MTKLLAAFAAVFALVPVTMDAARAQGKSKPQVTAAITFAKAGASWRGIVADRKALGEVIRNNKLSEAHELAFSIRDAVVTLPYKSNALSSAKKTALQKQVALVANIAET